MNDRQNSLSLIRPGTNAPVNIGLSGTTIEVDVSGIILTDLYGNPLRKDSAVELGYFAGATIHNLFAGSWIPLMGTRSSQRNSRIALIRTTTGRPSEGPVSWSRTFYGEMDDMPPNDAPLAIRIFDGADPETAGYCNTASHPSWWFRAPKAPDASFVFISLDTPAMSWESGPAGAFQTILATRPPPGGSKHVFSPRALRKLFGSRRARKEPVA